MNKEETKPVATSSLGYEYPRLGLFTHYLSMAGETGLRRPAAL